MTLPAPNYRGKVRDVYVLGDKLIINASDRISAFDVVFSEPIPGKGKILSQLSVFWFLNAPGFSNIMPNHLIETDPRKYPSPFCEHTEELAGRSMMVMEAKRIDFECVVRGYLAGSAWKEYKNFGTVNKTILPKGLKESGKLSEPIFTPATKAESGHDENISFNEMSNKIGTEFAGKLKDLSIKLYLSAAKFLLERGLILADTKFEFGFDNNNEIILIDEVLTPDSSRYWFESEYRPGRTQNPFDKQFLRDFLEESGWNKEPPAPKLPQKIIQGTLERYKTAFRLITKKEPSL